MKRNENPRVIETKSLLEKGLLRLLEHRSISKVSITALCEEAGVNRTTFYKYYESVEQLYDTIMERHHEKLVETYNKSFEKTGNIRSALIAALKYMINNEQETRISLKNTPDGLYTDTKIPVSKDAFREFGRQHNIPEDKVEAVFNYYAAGSFTLVKDWFLQEKRIKPEDEADVILYAINSNSKLCQDITGGK